MEPVSLKSLLLSALMIAVNCLYISRENAVPETPHLKDLDIGGFHNIPGPNNKLIYGSNLPELDRYRERVKILHNLLKFQCQLPDRSLNVRRFKRNIMTSRDVIQAMYLEVEKLLYERMSYMLIKCIQAKVVATTTPTTMPTTAVRTTQGAITMFPRPRECELATNLSDAWRQDHNGKKIRPINGRENCDTTDMARMGRPWFRFTGQAGNRLLNTCPPAHSCGTDIPLWSDEEMPNEIGVLTVVNVYGSWTSGCKAFVRKVSVIKCSPDENDFIYRYDDKASCHLSFCGMDA